MQFFYLDPQAQVHAFKPDPTPPQSIVDIDLHWIQLGHKIVPKRLHAMDCFEIISSEVAEDHQFTFRRWYESRSKSTHCVWYSIPKQLLTHFSRDSVQAKALIFVIPQFFPPTCRNKSLICFLDLPYCEAVLGYIQGHCVCFKKLSPGASVNVQQEWQYFQQAYPQWIFEHSLFLTSKNNAQNTLIHTHQHTIHMKSESNHILNRMALYGFSQSL